MADVQLKRAYEPAEPADGYRVLVDRLWPRGVSKADARVDRWEKNLAPSEALRKWFAHDPARWSRFRQRYRAEPIGGTWRIIRSTHEYTKTDAWAAQFNVAVPADGVATLKYRVRVTY